MLWTNAKRNSSSPAFYLSQALSVLILRRRVVGGVFCLCVVRFPFNYLISLPDSEVLSCSLNKFNIFFFHFAFATQCVYVLIAAQKFQQMILFELQNYDKISLVLMIFFSFKRSKLKNTIIFKLSRCRSGWSLAKSCIHRNMYEMNNNNIQTR